MSTGQEVKAAPLSDFIAKVKKDGIAKTNRFVTRFSLPSKMVNAMEGAKLVELFCEQSVLTGMNIASQAVRTYGESREVTYDRVFAPINLTFLVDRKMEVVKFFNDWIDIIVDPVTRLNGYYADYVSTVDIYIQDNQNRNTYASRLYECFPKTISDIQLDSSSKDAMRLNVQFVYKYSNGGPIVAGRMPTSIDPTTGETVGESSFGAMLGGYLDQYLSGSDFFPDDYFSAFGQYQQDLNDLMAGVSSGFETATGGIFT